MRLALAKLQDLKAIHKSFHLNSLPRQPCLPRPRLSKNLQCLSTPSQQRKLPKPEP